MLGFVHSPAIWQHASQGAVPHNLIWAQLRQVQGQKGGTLCWTLRKHKLGSSRMVKVLLTCGLLGGNTLRDPWTTIAPHAQTYCRVLGGDAFLRARYPCTATHLCQCQYSLHARNSANTVILPDVVSHRTLSNGNPLPQCLALPPSAWLTILKLTFWVCGTTPSTLGGKRSRNHEIGGPKKTLT